MTTASFVPNKTASYSKMTANSSQLEGFFMNATEGQPLGMAAFASENSTSTPSVLVNLITDAALRELLAGNSTTEFPVKEGGTWTTLAILAGLILAVILTFAIILTLFLCILQRKSRYRTVERVENPIYKGPNTDAVRTAALNANPSGSLVNKSSPKSGEQTWTSKVTTGFNQPAGKKSGFSSRDGAETSGLVDKKNEDNNDNLEHVNEKSMQQRNSENEVLKKPLLAPEPDKMPPVISTLNR